MASLTHGREFQQALGNGEGQGSLACCSPWGCKRDDLVTEQQQKKRWDELKSGQEMVTALCIRGPKDWSFSFNISPSNEHPGLISFRMDWLNLLAVQGTLGEEKIKKE